MELVQPGRRFDFMGKRRYFIGLSVALVLLSILACFRPGLRLGTDFRGGTEVEVRFTGDVTPAEIREAVEKSGFESPDVVAVGERGAVNQYILRVQEVGSFTEAQKAAVRERLCFSAEPAPADPRCEAIPHPTEVKFGAGGDRIIVHYQTAPDGKAIAERLGGVEGLRLADRPPGVTAVGERYHRLDIHLESKGEQLLAGVRRELGADRVPERALRTEWIGPKAGAQLRDSAVKSVIITLIFVMAYVAIRFDLRFAPGGILSLAHDVVLALGAMAITQREITLSTVAAMLTIVGYSINDTVIVYDRIRENLPKHRTLSFASIINLSVSEMLGRTLITSGVTALSLIAFLWWGTGALRDFSFAMLVGMAAGTYSSIYVAAPLTEWIDARFFQGKMTAKKKIDRRRAIKRPDAVV
jgi:preprotein translocase subunit SecF